MTTSGANIILDTNDGIGFGVYADIFRPSAGPLACKLFISFQHETNVKMGLIDPRDDDRRRRTCESECRAYEIAAQDAFLRHHIPGTFRRCEIADVVEDDESVAANYLLDCCYEMEFIEGVPAKLSMVDHLQHIKKAEQAFRRAGISYTSDASIFFAEDPQKFKFIDFAVEAFPPPPWPFKT